MTVAFVPPVISQGPRLLADTEGPAARLMRYMPAHAEGQNVYLYADGTVTRDHPTHTTAELASDVAPLFTYYGGHVYTGLSPFEINALTAAGYVMTTVTDPVIVIDPHTPQYGPDPQSGLLGSNSRGYGGDGYGTGAYGDPAPGYGLVPYGGSGYGL